MGISLKDKKVLVTGSTDGLGKHLAKELAKLSANVVLHGRDKQKVESVLNELKDVNPNGIYESVVCDFNKPETIDNCFGAIKDLDVLVNNAGVWYEGSTEEMGIERVTQMVNVNLLATLLVTQVLLPVVKKSEFGQILNVSSIAGVEIPVGYFHSVYSATKFGMQAFTEALAKEYSNTNVRIVGYYPGGMTTDLFVKAGQKEDVNQPWMFDTMESVEAMIFMLTRNPKVTIKRMDLINHIFEVPNK